MHPHLHILFTTLATLATLAAAAPIVKLSANGLMSPNVPMHKEPHMNNAKTNIQRRDMPNVEIGDAMLNPIVADMSRDMMSTGTGMDTSMGGKRHMGCEEMMSEQMVMGGTVEVDGGGMDGRRGRSEVMRVGMDVEDLGVGTEEQGDMMRGDMMEGDMMEGDMMLEEGMSMQNVEEMMI